MSNFDEGPSESDVRRFGHDTRTCPNCSSDQYDQAEFCAICGSSLDPIGGKGMPTWAKIAAGLALLGFALIFVL